MVVERAEVAKNLAELVDLPVLLRDEVEQIGVEMDARGPDEGDHADREGDDGDLFAVPEAELGERVEDSSNQRAGS